MASASASAPNAERDEHESRVKFFVNFLNANRDKWTERIDEELSNGRYRIALDLRELHEAEPGLDRKVLERPIKYLLPWEEGLTHFVGEMNEKSVQKLVRPLKLEFAGAFGRNLVTPRGMTSATLHQLMKVEGIVTKAGLTVPKLVQSIHTRKLKVDGYAEARDHRDATAFVNKGAPGSMPTHDSEGNELMMELGTSWYKDYQKFSIQEAPESTPAGEIPRSVEVICESELVERAKPGDRVQVAGVFKPFPGPAQDFTTGVFPTRIVANAVKPIQKLVEAAFVPEDVVNIREVGARADTFELLSRSFAPSICGHDKVKAGLLLQQVGGHEKTLANGTHLRGDMHVLMVGDPSCGKSQLLRFVMKIADVAISTTGKGSSGVGLTAAMIRDPTTREFNLEAGAMVLADRGAICIDEFDKMNQVDRVAIHEAMEQQSVTIAKAGMRVSLNARCSVVAAANPVFSNFDNTRSLAENIGLQDSLLSRFDLIYIVRDLEDEEVDRKIASQVLRQAYQQNDAGVKKHTIEEVHSAILERRQESEGLRVHKAAEVFQKQAPGPEGEPMPEVLTVDFVKKYLRYCKRLTPKLTEECSEEIANAYVKIRQSFQTGIADMADPNAKKKARLAVTTRSLEAIIRLATAHAKLKLRRDWVLKEDVQQAVQLIMDAREEGSLLQVGKGAVAPGEDTQEDARGDKLPQEGGAQSSGSGQGVAAAATAGGEISSARLITLTQLISRLFARFGESIDRDTLMVEVNNGLAEGEAEFYLPEFSSGLRVLDQQGKIMVDDDGVVYLTR